MTIRQIAEITKKSERTIQRLIHNLLPDVQVVNGVPVDLTEMQTYQLLKKLETPFHIIEPRQGVEVPRQNDEVKGIPSGASIRALESVYGKQAAADRIDYLIGYGRQESMSMRDQAALAIGRNILAKRDREAAQKKLFELPGGKANA